MLRVPLSWIAEKLEGKLVGTDIEIDNISTDTRNIATGDLFLALTGPRFNGHQFVKDAAKKGAAALIVSEVVDSDLPQIKVADTRLALGQLAAAIKSKVAPKTVAITGSSGKTTVKQMTSAILAQMGEVHFTKGNANNDIGVPLTLLGLEPQHEFAVIELGANHKGEIAYTTALTQPDVAVVLNTSASHLEGFGSVEGVAKAKGEIFSGLSANGLAVINQDSPFHDYWSEINQNRLIQRFSTEQVSDFFATDIVIDDRGCAHFTLQGTTGQIAISLTVPGRHNVANALVAAALSSHLGATLEHIKQGLLNMEQVGGRLNIIELTPQLRLIDDTYNANVASVMAAIELLSSYSGTRILVLGDMAELGQDALQYHRQAGEHANQCGIDHLFSLGSLSEQASNVMVGDHFTDCQALVNHLLLFISQKSDPVTLLVKGSRSAKMERVVVALQQWFDQDNQKGEQVC
jgi:UDP-N-acetylmuramoyl-tripeptide--D-alanyl-D-alanine ligase